MVVSKVMMAQFVLIVDYENEDNSCNDYGPVSACCYMLMVVVVVFGSRSLLNGP
jgi:hypothetical protein